MKKHGKLCFSLKFSLAEKIVFVSCMLYNMLEISWTPKGSAESVQVSVEFLKIGTYRYNMVISPFMQKTMSVITCHLLIF